MSDGRDAGAAPRPPQPLLRAEGLVRHFAVRRHLFSRTGGAVRAVDGVDLAVVPGETLGIVGESGCGKSTLGRLLLRLIEPTSGRVFFEGEDLASLGAAALRQRRRALQIIFQDPYSSLNPTMTVSGILAEPLRLHRLALSRAAVDARVAELLRTVGLSPEHARRYPHEFSGGQRQRIGIARALAVQPRLIVCDEAVSALDVSVQAQVINLLMELQRRFGLAYVFIAHDLAVVRHIATRVAVMYLGRIVEIGDKAEIFGHPRHPYTRALLDAVPRPEPEPEPMSEPEPTSAARAGAGAPAGVAAASTAAAGARGAGRLLLEGDLPNSSAPPPGCRFHTRCPFARQRCKAEEPALASVDAAGDHRAACHFAEEIFRTDQMARTAPLPEGDPTLARRLHRLQQAFVNEVPSTEEHR